MLWTRDFPMMVSILPPISGTLNSRVARPLRSEPLRLGVSHAVADPEPGAPWDLETISPRTFPSLTGLQISRCSTRHWLGNTLAMGPGRPSGRKLLATIVVTTPSAS